MSYNCRYNNNISYNFSSLISIKIFLFISFNFTSFVVSFSFDFFYLRIFFREKSL